MFETNLDNSLGENSVTCRVFTLNCWGIPYVSKDRRTRMYAIAKYLVSSNLDFVCLQEVWSKKDFLFLSKKCSFQLPYSHYFNSFVTGSGLCILSKYPIIDVYFHQWPINGYAHKIHQGDWFGGKGVGLCRIQMNNYIVNLYTCHLHAEYNYKSTEYLNHRVLQAFDTSQFIKLTSGGCDLAILAGDLNTEPHDLAMKVLNQNAQLTDCFNAAQEKSPACVGTNESSRNSYSPPKELKRQPGGKRIDYILFRNSPKLNVDVLQYRFPLPDRVPGCAMSYSDHEAVEATLQCTMCPIKTTKQSMTNVSDLHASLNHSVDICNDSLRKLRTTKHKYIFSSVVFGALLFTSLFAELFFNVPLDFGVSHTSTVVCFNLVKVIFTTAFLFSLLMATIWNKSEKSAILTGKFSMMLVLDRLRNSNDDLKIS